MHGTTSEYRVVRPDERRRTLAVTIAERPLTLACHDELAPLAPLWDELAAAGARASVFQSHGWLRTWIATAAAAAGETPLIVSLRDGDGRLAALLPLGITRVAGLPVAGLLGQSHANYGLALVEPELARRMSAADVRLLFRTIARAVPIAVVRLDHLPTRWNGLANPLAAGGIVSANDSHVLALASPFDGLFAARFSARTRSTLRRKARRLGDLGGYKLGAEADPARRLRLLDLFLAAKNSQLRQGGIADPFSAPGIAAFYRALAAEPAGAGPRLEITAIEAGGEIGAISLTVDDGARRYLLNTALPAGRLRDSSPGLLLLTRDIADATAAAHAHYDFGPGAAAYKAAWAPEPLPLVTTIFSLTPAGRPLAALMTAGAMVKRTIKRNPALWRAATKIRRGLFGARGGSQSRDG